MIVSSKNDTFTLTLKKSLSKIFKIKFIEWLIPLLFKRYSTQPTHKAFVQKLVFDDPRYSSQFGVYVNCEGRLPFRLIRKVKFYIRKSLRRWKIPNLYYRVRTGSSALFEKTRDLILFE